MMVPWLDLQESSVRVIHHNTMLITHIWLVPCNRTEGMFDIRMLCISHVHVYCTQQVSEQSCNGRLANIRRIAVFTATCAAATLACVESVGDGAFASLII